MNQQELSHALRKEAIKQGHSVQTVASGYSMFPFLRKGDLLTVEPVSMDKIKRGDVVVFESEEKWIAHRVIKIRNVTDGLEFLLRGDTRLAFDPLVNKGNYVGVIQVFSRKNGVKNITNKGLLFWKNIILAFDLLYNLPLYCARISLVFLLSRFRR